MPESRGAPHIVVLASLFPSRMQPGRGCSSHERMFRVGRQFALAVVAPTPGFLFRSLLPVPHFRPGRTGYRMPGGRRRLVLWFGSPSPVCCKHWGGLMMALGALPQLRRLQAGKGAWTSSMPTSPCTERLRGHLLSRRLSSSRDLHHRLRGSETRHVEGTEARAFASWRPWAGRPASLPFRESLKGQPLVARARGRCRTRSGGGRRR